MKRATEIVITRCDQAEDLKRLENTINSISPSAQLRKTIHAPRELTRLEDGEKVPLASLKGESVTAVCGIGNPRSFQLTLRSLGAHVDRLVVIPNHARIPASALPKDGMVIVTEKDAVRIDRAGSNVLSLGVELAEYQA